MKYVIVKIEGDFALNRNILVISKSEDPSGNPSGGSNVIPDSIGGWSTIGQCVAVGGSEKYPRWFQRRSSWCIVLHLTHAIILEGAPRPVPLTAHCGLVVAAAAGGVTELGVGPAPVPDLRPKVRLPPPLDHAPRRLLRRRTAIHIWKCEEKTDSFQNSWRDKKD